MVTDDLCQYLIFRTDGLMTTLAGEIDKIAAYQQGPAITRGAIDAVVIPALSAQTFDISDAVVKEDFETALSKLQELYAMQTDPIAVLGAIGRSCGGCFTRASSCPRAAGRRSSWS